MGLFGNKKEVEQLSDFEKIKNHIKETKDYIYVNDYDTEVDINLTYIQRICDEYNCELISHSEEWGDGFKSLMFKKNNEKK